MANNFRILACFIQYVFSDAVLVKFCAQHYTLMSGYWLIIIIIFMTDNSASCIVKCWRWVRNLICRNTEQRQRQPVEQATLPSASLQPLPLTPPPLPVQKIDGSHEELLAGIID